MVILSLRAPKTFGQVVVAKHELVSVNIAQVIAGDLEEREVFVGNEIAGTTPASSKARDSAELAISAQYPLMLACTFTINIYVNINIYIYTYIHITIYLYTMNMYNLYVFIYISYTQLVRHSAVLHHHDPI